MYIPSRPQTIGNTLVPGVKENEQTKLSITFQCKNTFCWSSATLQQTIREALQALKIQYLVSLPDSSAKVSWGRIYYK